MNVNNLVYSVLHNSLSNKSIEAMFMAYSEKPNGEIESASRRKAVKKIVTGVSALTAYSILPTRWERPIVEQIFLPAHAKTSGDSDYLITSSQFPSDLDLDPDHWVLVTREDVLVKAYKDEYSRFGSPLDFIVSVETEIYNDPNPPDPNDGCLGTWSRRISYLTAKVGGVKIDGFRVVWGYLHECFDGRKFIIDPSTPWYGGVWPVDQPLSFTTDDGKSEVKINYIYEKNTSYFIYNII